VLYWSEGYTAGDSSTIGDLLTLAGARNAASELGIRGSKPISVEDVVRLSPDWILRSGWEAGGGMKSLPQALLDLPAVRENHVAVVPGKILLSTSHRVAFASDSLVRLLHPGCR
jgi:iron complex transport system substrate-binding protein